MEDITIEKLRAMKDADLMAADPQTAVDIADVVIQEDLPERERIADYIHQIKNPYLFKSGDLIIKVSFDETELTLADCLRECYRLL